MGDFEQWYVDNKDRLHLTDRIAVRNVWNAALSLQGEAVELNPSDIEVDEYGGRYAHIHIPNNYIRVTHKSGISVSCEKHRSKHANKAEAMKGLKLILSNEYSAAKIAEQEALIKELKSELTEQARLLGISAERELALQAKIQEVEKMVNALLAHCDNPECLTCGEIVCPHKEPLHFHHDGCPACAQYDAFQERR